MGILLTLGSLFETGKSILGVSIRLAWFPSSDIDGRSRFTQLKGDTLTDSYNGRMGDTNENTVSKDHRAIERDKMNVLTSGSACHNGDLSSESHSIHWKDT